MITFQKFHPILSRNSLRICHGISTAVFLWIVLLPGSLLNYQRFLCRKFTENFLEFFAGFLSKFLAFLFKVFLGLLPVSSSMFNCGVTHSSFSGHSLGFPKSSSRNLFKKILLWETREQFLKRISLREYLTNFPGKQWEHIFDFFKWKKGKIPHGIRELNFCGNYRKNSGKISGWNPARNVAKIYERILDDLKKSLMKLIEEQCFFLDILPKCVVDCSFKQ